MIFIRIPERNQKWEGSFLKGLLPKLDLLGFALFAPAAIMFLLALEYGGGKEPWNSPTIIGLFVGAAANFLVFLAWEYRTGEDAMIPLSMVAQRQVWTSMVVMALTWVVSLSPSASTCRSTSRRFWSLARDERCLYLTEYLVEHVSAVVSGILGKYYRLSSRMNGSPPSPKTSNLR